LFVALIGVLCLGATLGARAEIEVQAEVSPQSVTLGGTVSYTLSISMSNGNIDTDRLQVPAALPLDGLADAGGGPSHVTQVDILNGMKQETRKFVWTLTALREGVAKIGAVEVVYGDKKYALAAYEVKVAREEPQPAAASGGGQGPAGVPAPQSEYPALSEQLRGRLFARMTVSNAKPYLQEPITVTGKIYVDPQLAPQIANVNWSSPNWVDFFSQEVELGRVQLAPETLDGKQYMSAMLWQWVLAPTRTGKIEIPLSVAGCAVRVRTSGGFEERFFNDSMFGSPFFARTAPVRLPAAPLTLEVKPLPLEGRPASFRNAVGNFAFAARVDRTDITQDDLLTLTLEIGGEGYLGSIALPQLPKMPDWSQAGRQVKTEGAVALKAFRGKKVFEILLRPEKTGVLTIPAISCAFFNPSAQRYVKSKAGPFQIRVTPGTARPPIVSESSPTTGIGAAPPQFYGERLSYIHTDFPDSPRFVPIYRRPYFVPFQFVPLAAIVLALGFRARTRYVERHQDRLRYRGAGTRARREFREATAALRAGNGAAFHEKLGDALRTYLATKFGRSAAGLTLEEIETTCLGHGVDPEHAGRARRILERCDQARYLGEAARAEDMQRDLEESEKLLAHLDKRLA
jgi:hypothetical protein